MRTTPFSMTTLRMLIIGWAVPLIAQQAPCPQITAACEKAGFTQGGASTGTGLQTDCIDPIMRDTAQPKGARLPLPHVAPTLIALCKAHNPEFGEAKASSTAGLPAGSGTVQPSAQPVGAGSLPSAAAGSLPSAATGPLPSAAAGSLPSAAAGSLPSAATGSLPSAATGSLPSAGAGSLQPATPSGQGGQPDVQPHPVGDAEIKGLSILNTGSALTADQKMVAMAGAARKAAPVPVYPKATITPSQMYQSGFVYTNTYNPAQERSPGWSGTPNGFIQFLSGKSSQLDFFVTVQPNTVYMFDCTVEALALNFGGGPGLGTPKFSIGSNTTSQTTTGANGQNTEFAFVYVSNSAGTAQIVIYSPNYPWIFQQCVITSTPSS